MDKRLLSNKEAANVIGVCPSDLATARVTGTLGDLTPPPFVRIGRRIRYNHQDLELWINELPRFTNLSEETAVTN